MTFINYRVEMLCLRCGRFGPVDRTSRLCEYCYDLAAVPSFDSPEFDLALRRLLTHEGDAFA